MRLSKGQVGEVVAAINMLQEDSMIAGMPHREPQVLYAAAMALAVPGAAVAHWTLATKRIREAVQAAMDSASIPVAPPAPPLNEGAIRKIIREELTAFFGKQLPPVSGIPVVPAKPKRKVLLVGFLPEQSQFICDRVRDSSVDFESVSSQDGPRKLGAVGAGDIVVLASKFISHPSFYTGVAKGTKTILLSTTEGCSAAVRKLKEVLVNGAG